MRELYNVSKLAVITVLVFSLYSCATANRIKEMKTELKRNILLNKEALLAIEKVDSAREAKFDKGLLDENSNSFISKFSDSVKQVLTKHVTEDSVILSKRIKHRSVDTLSVRIKRITEEAKANLSNISLIDELLATNTFTQLNTASVFGPGQFIIDLQNNPSAADPFKKVATDMLAFATKFPNKKLNGTFMVIGYADAQQISQGSALDSTLRQSMGVETATSPQLNRELSRLRAKSVTEVLSGIMVQQVTGNDLYKNLHVDYLPQGRGEDFPNPKIKDYREDDERRRVVFVYWSILPDFN